MSEGLDEPGQARFTGRRSAGRPRALPHAEQRRRHRPGRPVKHPHAAPVYSRGRWRTSSRALASSRSSCAQPTVSNAWIDAPMSAACAAMSAAASTSPRARLHRKAARRLAELDLQPVDAVTPLRAVPVAPSARLLHAAKCSACRSRRRVGETGRGELVLDVLPDRLEHHVATGPRGVVGDDERLAHERVDQVEHGQLVVARRRPRRSQRGRTRRRTPPSRTAAHARPRRAARRTTRPRCAASADVGERGATR